MSSQPESELLQIKKLMCRILRQYYTTNDIVEKSELEEKYLNLLQKSKDYKDEELAPDIKAEIELLETYSRLFEEYHTTNNIVRKEEIKEIFSNLETT